MCVMICGFVCVCVHMSDCSTCTGMSLSVFSLLECLQEGDDQICVQALLYTCTQYPLVDIRRKHSRT